LLSGFTLFRVAIMISTEAGTQSPPRAPYTPPTLEPLGEWSALTLQQSIVITGVFSADAEGTSRTV
jgi:hypothetical protein